MNKWTVFLNLGIPVLIVLVMLLASAFISKAAVSVISMWIVWVILPAVLAVVNLVLFFSGIEISFFRGSLFMLLGLLLGLMFGFVIWGMLSKDLFHPDAGTISTNQTLAIHYACFVGILFLVVKAGQFLFHMLAKR